jgi:hypothetical protein
VKPFNFSYVIGSTILGISLIIGCLIIQGSYKGISVNKSNVVDQQKPLMTIKETAEFLNLSEFQVRTIISSEETELTNTGAYSGKMFPVIKIGNELHISTNDLSEWLKDSTAQRKQY